MPRGLHKGAKSLEKVRHRGEHGLAVLGRG